MAIRLLADRGVGRAAGTVFAVSTTGSILGTYLPTLVLIPRLGSRGSILVAAGILLATAAMGLFVFRRGCRVILASVLLLGSLAVCSAAAACILTPRRPLPRLAGATTTLLDEVESPYQYLTVRDDAYPAGVERVLTINEGRYSFHALQVQGHVLTGSRFYDAYAVLPFLLDLEPGDIFRACIVGLACGGNATQWHHFFSALYDLRVDGAELDPGIIRLGRRHFGLPREDARWLLTYPLDGRTLLEWLPAEQPYNAIVVDAFQNELYVPFHLATQEFFRVCRRRLAPGGVLAMNVHAYEADAPNLRAIESTMASVFPFVLRIPHYATGGFLLLARHGDRPFDLDRLTPKSIRRRYEAEEGIEAWREPPEWAALLALADNIHATAVTGGKTVRPAPGDLVLTDDHAPLEWLTDRFLWSTEADLLTTGDARSLALNALRRKQASLLTVVAVGWTLLLTGLGFALRNDRR